MQESSTTIAADDAEQLLMVKRFTLGGLPKRLAMQVE